MTCIYAQCNAVIKTKFKPNGCCGQDYCFHCLVVNPWKVRGEVYVSESVALVLIESEKKIKLTVRGHRPILFRMTVFIFRADLQRSWSTTEPSLLSVLTCSNGKIAKQKRWKVSRRYISAICTWAKKKKKMPVVVVVPILWQVMNRFSNASFNRMNILCGGEKLLNLFWQLL